MYFWPRNQAILSITEFAGNSPILTSTFHASSRYQPTQKDSVIFLFVNRMINIWKQGLLESELDHMRTAITSNDFNLTRNNYFSNIINSPTIPIVAIQIVKQSYNSKVRNIETSFFLLWYLIDSCVMMIQIIGYTGSYFERRYLVST